MCTVGLASSFVHVFSFRCLCDFVYERMAHAIIPVVGSDSIRETAE